MGLHIPLRETRKAPFYYPLLIILGLAGAAYSAARNM